MARQIEFFYDYMSPFSYLADTQLPAIARGGTALVISPLIALMDDQAAKLSALGLSVARIHSGLDRAVARQDGESAGRDAFLAGGARRADRRAAIERAISVHFAGR